MGIFVPLDAGVQVEILHTYGGEVIENRLWFRYDNPPYTATEIQGLTDGVANWWMDNLLPYLSDQLSTAIVLARDWSGSVPGPSIVTGIGIAGGVAGPAYSANVAVVVPFKWPLGFRLKKNKNYVPGIPDAGIVLNTVQPDFNDVLFEGYAALVDAARLFYPVLNWRWVVTSAFEGGVARSEQLWKTCQGVPQNTIFKVGQRRTRLP